MQGKLLLQTILNRLFELNYILPCNMNKEER